MWFPRYFITHLTFVFSILLSLYLRDVLCDVRFVCPPPVSSVGEKVRSDTRHTACRSNGENFANNHIDLTPGIHTVKFESTTIHKDAPFRISLHHYHLTGKDQPCVLRDHIPHNNDALISHGCKKDTPGTCPESTYYINMNIPDVFCPKCFLKLTQFLVDTAPDSTCNEANSTCEAFISCANVKIRSSTGTQDFASQCHIAQTSHRNVWLFDPTYIYTSTVHDLHLRLTLTFMPTINRLEFLAYNNELLTIDDLILIHTTEITVTDNATQTWNLLPGQETNDLTIAGYITVDDFVHDLITSDFMLLVNTKHSNYNSTVNHDRTLYKPGVYSRLHHTYTKSGWLTGSYFIGPDAPFSRANIPQGLCSPHTHHYITSVSELKDGTLTHQETATSLLSLTFVDERVHVSGAFHALPSSIVNIRISGPILSGYTDLIIPGRSIKNNLLRVSLDAEQYMPYVGTTQFLRLVTIEMVEKKIYGLLQQGIAADIESALGLCGVGIFQFLLGASLHYSILAYAGSKSLVTVALNGPARQGIVANSLFTLTPYFYTYRSGWIFGNASIYISDSAFLLHLWTRQVYVGLSFNSSEHSRSFSGQLSLPGDWLCDKEINVFCPASYITAEKKKSETTSTPSLSVTNKTTGVAVLLWDRVDVLQYSVWLRNPQRETITSGHIITDDVSFYELHPFKELFREDFVYLTQGTIADRSSDFNDLLSNGKLQLSITTSTKSHHKLTTPLPAVHRPACFQSRMKFYVEQDSVWTYKSRPIKILHALVNDSVQFIHPDMDSVYVMSDAVSYNLCEFNTSTLIGQYLTLTRTGDYYVVSYMKCSKGAKFIVNVKDRAVTTNASYCGQLVFETWWNQELSSHGGSNILGAALGAAVIGGIIVATLIVADLYVRKHTKPDGFERF